MANIEWHHDCNSYRSFAKLPMPRTCKRCGLGPCTSGTEKRSNNPPAAVLELDMADAKFLLRNCDANIALGLNLLMTYGPKDRAKAEQLIELNEGFKRIRDMLKKQGITNDEAEDKG